MRPASTRGLVRDKMGQLDAAIADFSMAVELEPDNAIYVHNRGYCYRNKGDFAQACVDCLPGD